MMIVALDVATRVGVAAGRIGGDPVSSSVDLGAGKSEEHRFCRALKLTSFVIEKYQPDLLAIEAPVGGPKTSHFLVGLLACVRGEAQRQGVDSIIYPINAIRRHFLGRNLTVRDFPHMKTGAAKLAIKQSVIGRCEMLGWKPRDADCADGLALWDYACAKHGAVTVPAGGLF